MKKRPQKVRIHRFHSLNLFITHINYTRLINQAAMADAPPADHHRFVGMETLRLLRSKSEGTILDYIAMHKDRKVSNYKLKVSLQ